MKKIFILTGEPSGDKLASKVITKIKKKNSDISYLAVGGDYLNAVGVKSLYNLNEVTYLGFTKVLLNIFRIKKKIDYTVNKIIEFNPDILFSVDSPDFTLRIAKRVKKIKPSIKTIHFVAPKVYVWRDKRVKKLKSFLDHILLLFPFEKKYFEKENMKSSFVGHPLLDNEKNYKINISSFVKMDKKIISIFPGSRISEVKTLMPILIKFINLAQSEHKNLTYIFHTTNELKDILKNFLIKSSINSYEIISEESIKHQILNNTTFAIAKSGTISLEICNSQIPSLIIYKMNFINFFIIKFLVKIRFANIFNIMANSEIIPELLQSNCNPNKIYEVFNSYIFNSDIKNKQISSFNKLLNQIKTEIPASEKIATILNENL